MFFQKKNISEQNRGHRRVAIYRMMKIRLSELTADPKDFSDIVKEEVRVHVVDLSLGGLQFVGVLPLDAVKNEQQSILRIKEGDFISFSLRLDAKSPEILASGRIVWAHCRTLRKPARSSRTWYLHAGVAFGEISKENQNLIQHFLTTVIS